MSLNMIHWWIAWLSYGQFFPSRVINLNGFWPRAWILSWFSPSDTLISPTSTLFSSVSLFSIHLTWNGLQCQDFCICILPVLVFFNFTLLSASISSRHFLNFLHSTYSISSTWRCVLLLFYLPTLLSFQRKTHRSSLIPSSFLRVSKCISLNICLYLKQKAKLWINTLCLFHWLPSPPSYNLLVQWYNEAAHPNTRLSWNP